MSTTSGRSQCAIILNYLKKHKTITAWDCMMQLHIMRVSARIYDLRARGHEIISHMETSESGAKFARYELINRH